MLLADTLASVRQRIRTGCEKAGRSPDDVTLIAVTKTADPAAIKEAVRLGVTDIGENRVQDALEKHAAIGDAARWHMIGHLQTNKARDAVRLFSLIHSVDSIRLAREIDKEAKKIGKVQEILLEVNVSQEATKFGINPDDVTTVYKEIAPYANIQVKGLMTIAPEVADPEMARPYFRRLKELKDALYELRELSMGMTNDFEVAIAEGATMVRVGRALFKG